MSIWHVIFNDQAILSSLLWESFWPQSINKITAWGVQISLVPELPSRPEMVRPGLNKCMLWNPLNRTYWERKERSQGEWMQAVNCTVSKAKSKWWCRDTWQGSGITILQQFTWFHIPYRLPHLLLYNFTTVCSQCPSLQVHGLTTVTLKRNWSSSKRSCLKQVVPSSPCQSWDQRRLASSTCACRSAPWRGAYLGLTPACDGSNVHILQETNVLVREARIELRTRRPS